jgi:hypothetical protein
MSLIRAVLGRRKKPEALDPNPDETDQMPVRPYRILKADLPFFSDPDCRIEVQGARLIILQCEDPAQKQHPIECMPVLKHYRSGDVVRWDINHKRMWPSAWFVNPENGEKEQAWLQAVEFVGPVARSRRPPNLE